MDEQNNNNNSNIEQLGNVLPQETLDNLDSLQSEPVIPPVSQVNSNPTPVMPINNQTYSDNGQFGNKQSHQNNYEDLNQKEKGNFWWGVLGFFIPLVGIILYFVWKKERHGDSKCAGIGALIRIIVSFILTIVIVLSMGSLLNFVSNLVKEADYNITVDYDDNIYSDYDDDIYSDFDDDQDVTDNNSNNNDSNTNVVVNDLLTANYHGVEISFPTTWDKSFSKTGLTWEKSQTDLAAGYTTSGGRIGTYPGGVVVTVVNTSNETKKFQDCTIDSGTFYNPKDGSENATFIGGLNYNSTLTEVKNYFEGAGYKNCTLNDLTTAQYYKCFLNDDLNNKYNYIEFYYFSNIIYSIQINTN